MQRKKEREKERDMRNIVLKQQTKF